jgi:hypothetical protein
MFCPKTVKGVDANFEPTPGEMSVKVGIRKNANETVDDRLNPLSREIDSETVPGCVCGGALHLATPGDILRDLKPTSAK